jgi:hypothetical protein
MSVIIRPFPSLLDEAKVSRFMAEWSDSEFTPIGTFSSSLWQEGDARMIDDLSC